MILAFWYFRCFGYYIYLLCVFPGRAAAAAPRGQRPQPAPPPRRARAHIARVGTRTRTHTQGGQEARGQGPGVVAPAPPPPEARCQGPGAVAPAPASKSMTERMASAPQGARMSRAPATHRRANGKCPTRARSCQVLQPHIGERMASAPRGRAVVNFLGVLEAAGLSERLRDGHRGISRRFRESPAGSGSFINKCSLHT